MSVRTPRAVVLAGPPGAGKSTVARTALSQGERSYLRVDADEFKELLLRQALSDGTYESFVKPQAVRDREARGEVFVPLELASLVHRESSMLAADLTRQAIQARRDIIVDTVLAAESNGRRLLEQMQAQGYEVRMIDVEVPYEVSQARIRERWASGRAQVLAGGDDLEGAGGCRVSTPAACTTSRTVSPSRSESRSSWRGSRRS
ncbi:hypothetical protein GCM10025875_37010 [Litorihabitans aurantiacus]|uniref:UDP-N-acetylglucosamine kinase n=1 Tax=Litorihabitans aurantiacus TaxID=1930061 RepID=A0AA38CXQ3_9MICO|nr:hypothetical protein GCM10025875_36340 [Litorihabitans aurantiacus]GMA33709.1 hypothetical protein GCM10025875_37010 [Litorihabitans aurantiacus]